MEKASLNKYLDAIKHEILRLDNKEFIGNISFRLNMKYGEISNMNVDQSKSIKLTEEYR